MPGAERAGRLLLAIHHLAVDGVSWRILVPDLAAAWQALVGGAGGCAAARAGTSFRRWAQRLAAQAQDAERRGGAVVLARDAGASRRCCWSEGALDPVRDVAGTAGHLTLTLPAAVTEALLTRVPAAFHGGINDVLLTGLALAVADWCRRHGRRGRIAGGAAMRCCSIWKATAARRSFGASVDLIADGGLVHQPLPGAARSGAARSGGGAVGRRCARPGAEDASRSSCARCPTRGSATGCCAISTPRRRGSLPALPAPQLGFNYLGRFAAAATARTGRRLAGR